MKGGEGGTERERGREGERERLYLRVAMFLDVHLSKGAHISNARDIDGKVPQEVDDLRGSGSQIEVQDEWCHYWTEHLIQDVHLQHICSTHIHYYFVYTVSKFRTVT